MKKQVRTLVVTAAVAGIYAALTIFLAPISYGPIQYRLSEIMVLLAFINPSFAPGLILGCVIANFFSPFGMIDVVVGTIATSLAVLPMGYIKNIYLASLLPVVSNGIIVGLEIAILSNLPKIETMLYVGFGEAVVVSLVGVITVKLLLKNKEFNRIVDTAN